MGEILSQFVRRQVHIVEGDDPRDGLLHDLGSPAGFAPGVKTLAAFESEHLEHGHQRAKTLPGTAIGVMVVISPAEAELILPRFCA